MLSSSVSLSTIGFDADDTLWQNERFYRLTEERFAALLADHAESENLSAKLLEAERRNLQIYGFGIKGFTRSMVETAIEVTGGQVSAEVIGEILAAGREMLAHPVEILPYAREAIERLAGSYRILLITKGDLLEQERKLAQSGLGGLFYAVEIVSEKTPSTYERIFSQHGDGPQRSMMVGNSLKSDVVPAIEAGGWGVYVPHDLTWVLEHHEEPVDKPRYRRVKHLGELVDLVSELK
jgi:putative hydrolase of the HAD superfamily